MNFVLLDYLVFGAYALLIIGLGLWVSREKKGHKKTSEDYFLASKALPWWAIGASLIASNISAEQFIGMSGSGFRVGLAIASYEWMAAITLLVVAFFFLPIYLKKGIFTMPQFLEQRYNKQVRTLLAVFWLLVFVFVNLTSVLHLGALAMENIMGVSYWLALVGLAVFAVGYSLYGGLKAVAWTDVVQVFFLIGGGLITTWLALDHYGGEAGVVAGLSKLMDEIPGHFSMILEEGELMYQNDAGEAKDAYQLLPGLGVLIGGMWIANLYYWGCNQYIIQRTLAAKSLSEAQRGVVFAGFLKLLLPLIVVIPGIVAYGLDAPIGKADEAYPWLLGEFVGPGIRGLAFAALIAAVVSSLASMMNSTSTIFTLDIYREYLKPKSTERELVLTGRITALAAMVIAVFVAYPLLGQTDQVFQFIQEYTGYVSPGVLAIFIMGLFWKKATSRGALVAATLSIPLSLLINYMLPDMPFLNRMGVVFLLACAAIVGVSLAENRGEDHPKGISLGGNLFSADGVAGVLGFVIFGLTALLYALFW
jgi:solute:Na+ symporter, SSS family